MPTTCWNSAPHLNENRIGGVTVNVIACSVVGSGFEPRSCQTRLYNWHVLFLAAFRRKCKCWLARN
jgi:hypothetical protein